MYSWAIFAVTILMRPRGTYFVIYITAVIAVSLVVYIVFLKNKGPNWLDGTRR